MPRGQRNIYILGMADGTKREVIGSSYDQVKKSIRTFNVNALTIQRKFKNGTLGEKLIV